MRELLLNLLFSKIYIGNAHILRKTKFQVFSEVTLSYWPSDKWENRIILFEYSRFIIGGGDQINDNFELKFVDTMLEAFFIEIDVLRIRL